MAVTLAEVDGALRARVRLAVTDDLAKRLVLRRAALSGEADVVMAAIGPQPVVPGRPFRDPDPFGELAFATPLAARRAIADEIRLPLARLSDEDRAFIDALLTRTLARPEVLAAVRERFPPGRRGGVG